MDAYDEVVQLLEEKDNQSQPLINTFQPNPIKKIEPKSPEELISQFGDLRISLNKVLGTLVDELTNQTELLSQTKITLLETQKELEETYKIKQTASTLQNLFAIQESKKSELEAESAEFKAGLEKERRALEEAEKERKQELDKQRKLEQEEYDYILKLARQKDKDEYAKSKLEQEQILASRQAEFG